ncbi:MAG: hypothetical protein ACT4TC_20570 [Myxococcaceae bacterium]
MLRPPGSKVDVVRHRLGGGMNVDRRSMVAPSRRLQAPSAVPLQQGLSELMAAERRIGNGDGYLDGRESTVFHVQQELEARYGVRVPYKLLDEEALFGRTDQRGVVLGRAPSPVLRVAAYHEGGHWIYGDLRSPESLTKERRADFFAGYQHGVNGHVLFDDSVLPFRDKPVLPNHDGPEQRIETLYAGYNAGLNAQSSSSRELPQLPDWLKP